MTEMTVPHLLKRAAFKYPDREAIVSEKGRRRHPEWREKVHAVVALRDGEAMFSKITEGSTDGTFGSDR